MVNYTMKSRKLAKRLNSQYKKLGSWRKVAALYSGVSFATLNRIANGNGTWVPKDNHLLELLGLTSKVRIYHKISDLSPKDLLYVLEHRVLVTPEVIISWEISQQ